LVYLDVFGLVNAAADALLLWAVGRLVDADVPPWRLAAAALVGGVYASLSLVPSFLPLAGFLGKAGVPLLMVLVAYGRRPGFWTRVGAFYALAFSAAGLALGLSALLTSPLSGPGPYLAPILSGGAIAFAGESGRRLWRRRLVRQGVWALGLEVGGRRLSVPALVDSGCRLVDPFSRCPVVVVEEGALAGLLPAEVLKAVASGDPEALARLVERHPSWAERLRPLPFVSLGQADGLLWGFRPDRIWLGPSALESAAAQAVVGVSPHLLSHRGEFRALVPADLLPPVQREGGAA
jgi:stage II sporulation protein GA (sporulation sigma-E factor processing peptidase)